MPFYVQSESETLSSCPLFARKQSVIHAANPAHVTYKANCGGGVGLLAEGRVLKGRTCNAFEILRSDALEDIQRRCSDAMEDSHRQRATFRRGQRGQPLCAQKGTPTPRAGLKPPAHHSSQSVHTNRPRSGWAAATLTGEWPD